MRIKDVILTGVCIFSFLVPAAQETQKCLVLLKNDDSTVYFPLADEPKITFQAWQIFEEMIIESDNGCFVFMLPEQNKLEIQEVEINEVASITLDSKTEMNIVGQEIIVNTTVPKTIYSVVSLKGEKILAGQLPIGVSAISIKDLHPEIYIITIGEKSLKVHIK